jgi:hypothetical protein
MINPFGKPIARIYGPYVKEPQKGTARRRQLAISFEDGTRTSIPYARWLMTQHLGRKLLPTEHVDHINEDPLDDRISNYQLLSPAQNSRKSLLGKPSPIKGIKKGFTHGTDYGWMREKCKCDLCSDRKRMYYDRFNERISSKKLVNDDVSHGSVRQYGRGCRCDLCKEARKLYMVALKMEQPVDNSKQIAFAPHGES